MYIIISYLISIGCTDRAPLALHDPVIHEERCTHLAIFRAYDINSHDTKHIINRNNQLFQDTDNEACNSHITRYKVTSKVSGVSSTGSDVQTAVILYKLAV